MNKFLIRVILIILGLLVSLILFVAVALTLASFKGFCGWYAMSLFAVVVAQVESWRGRMGAPQSTRHPGNKRRGRCGWVVP